MGFSIYYRSTEPVPTEREFEIRRAIGVENEGRSWLSCEPINLFGAQTDGHLFGGSKPNFHPDPDDAASAAASGLPDGSVRDLIDGLCRISRDHGIDWEITHDEAPGPIGCIRRGVCDPGLLDQVDARADLAAFLGELEDEEFA